MADIKVTKDSKLIKVLADQARGLRVDSANADEAAQIITELASDMNPQNRHEIAQTVAFTVNRMQEHELDFMNQFADIKNIGYGDKAAFNVKTRGIKAYRQAKGSTTPRSMVAGKQILVGTEEISARPAINIMDLRTGRVNMADLIREANREMTNLKLEKVEKVLHDSIDDFATPFYASSTGGINKTNLDAQIDYFRRLGPVSIVGDIAAVSQLQNITGMNMNSTPIQRSDDMINEYNANGFIGRYNGCDVVAMTNAYPEGSTTPILKTNWLYILPGNMSADARNLKVVNEGSVQAFEAQDINDLIYEIRLDQWFGAAFVTGELPTAGAHKLN